MRVVFRTDASVRIGTGHVIRCATLAEELIRRGAEVHFVCREHDGHLSDWLAEKTGLTVHRLKLRGEPIAEHAPSGLAHEAWLGDSWQNDVLETLSAIYLIGHIDWLVVDHYALDERWEKAFRPFVTRILTIDDLADRRHDCNALLDQNYFVAMENRYENLIPREAKTFLGPRYALLRPEFAALRAKAAERAVNDRPRVLVFFGGSDPRGLAITVAKTLLPVIERRRAVLDLVTGPLSPHLDKAYTTFAGMKDVTIHAGHAPLGKLISRADVFIGAGGTTTWERACLGVPSIVIASAENQRKISEDVARYGAHIYLGDADSVTSEEIALATDLLLSNAPMRRLIQERALDLTDGNGTMRLALALAAHDIRLRPAEERDCENIYAWRNHPETRKVSFDKSEFTLETHRRWFANVLNNPNKFLLIAETEGAALGVVLIDAAEDSAWISVYLIPGLYHRGLGTRMLEVASTWTRRNHPEIEKLYAKIVPNNAISLRAFAKAGYRPYANIFRKDLYDDR